MRLWLRYITCIVTCMTAFQLTQVYLEPRQKAALQARAKAKGTKVAEEIRKAIDAYLAGVTVEELELLDAATKEAALHFDAIDRDLKRINAKVDDTLARIDALRVESPVAEYKVRR